MKKTKLLLIDDEKPLLQNLKQILEFEDFEVITAGNGIEGLSQYEKESPDLVICDIMMPEMDGYGFIKSLRSKGHTSTPFIFLTAKSEYDDLREGMNFGADDYLVKPVKSSQLLEAINIRLQRKREINKKLELQLSQIENGFRLITDQEFFTSVYDIIGYLHLLKSKHHQLDEESLQEYFGYMERSSNRLLSLLRKVKNWHEQEKRFLENNDKFYATAIKDVLQRIATGTAKYYNRDSDLLCNVIEDASLNVNTGFIETLFSELIDNAFKFSQKGNPVVISSVIENGNYSVKILDSSNKTKIDSLINFKPLQKTSKSSDNESGVGLGLTIVDLLVKSINGKLSFAKNDPSGVIAIVDIPIPIDDEPTLKDIRSKDE